MAIIYSGTVKVYSTHNGGVNWSISDAGLLSITKTSTGDQYDGYFFDGKLGTTLSLTSTMISKVKNITFGSGTILYINSNFLDYRQFTNLESITLQAGFATVSGKSLSLNLSNCFNGCAKLKSVTFPSGFASCSITKTSSMFYGCSALTSVNLSNVKLQTVTDAGGMFYNCALLTSVTFGNNSPFSSTTSMQSMFLYCKSLTTINGLSYIQTSNVTNMKYMFVSAGVLKLERSISSSL